MWGVPEITSGLQATPPPSRPAAQADGMVQDVCLWRLSERLGKKRRLPAALAKTNVASFRLNSSRQRAAGRRAGKSGNRWS